MFTKKDCVRTMCEPTEGDSNAGCIGILDFDKANFKPEYRIPENQLFRILGGFGSSPSKMGNAVIGYFCSDGEHCRQERYQFIGIANAEVTRYAEELESRWKEDKK